MAMAAYDGDDMDPLLKSNRKKRRLLTKTPPEECYGYTAFPMKPGALTRHQYLNK